MGFGVDVSFPGSSSFFVIGGLLGSLWDTFDGLGGVFLVALATLSFTYGGLASLVSADWEPKGFDSGRLVVFSFGCFFSLSFLLDFLEVVGFIDCFVFGKLGFKVSVVGVLAIVDCELGVVSCVMSC